MTGGVYLMGEFNTNALIFGAGQTIANTELLLRDAGIFYKTPITATDPT